MWSLRRTPGWPGRPAEEVVGEADVSTQHVGPCQEARLSSSHVDPRRSSDPEVASDEGAGASVGVIGRIQDRTTFLRFRTDARRVRAGELWCAALVDEGEPSPRIAYAIGRAVGSAVVRNRVRRRLRAIATSEAHVVLPGRYLIGVRPAAAQCSFEELKAMFLSLFDQVREVSAR